jgi:hypothetical protein
MPSGNPSALSSFRSAQNKFMSPPCNSNVVSQRMDLRLCFSVGICRLKLVFRCSRVDRREVTAMFSDACSLVNFLSHAGTWFALLHEQGCLKDWLPGVAGYPTSTGIPVFGGSVLGKRGLAPAPFFVLGCVIEVVSFSDVFSQWLVCLVFPAGGPVFSPGGRKTSRTSVWRLTVPATVWPPPSALADEQLPC